MVIKKISTTFILRRRERPTVSRSKRVAAIKNCEMFHRFIQFKKQSLQCLGNDFRVRQLCYDCMGKTGVENIEIPMTDFHSNYARVCVCAVYKTSEVFPPFEKQVFYW